MRWTASRSARTQDTVESMERAEAVRHRQCEALGTAREPGGFESIILSRGLDAIRDSRIAYRDGFRDSSWSRSASEVRSRCVSAKTASVTGAE